MSGMNFLEKLLDGVAVKWKTLEEVANFANGKGHEKDIIEDGKYVVVNSKFISTDGRVAKFSNIQICPLFKDDILLVMSDLPNGKALSKTFIVDAGDRYTLNQRIGGITVKNQGEILPKFLHCFLNRTPQLLKYDNGVDQTNLRKDQILGVKIPIPCPENPKKSLAIQAEIVRILDTFTALTAELTAELTDRKKQYNYYRDRLLTFEKGEVEWKTLGEIGQVRMCKRIFKSQTSSEGDIPFYKIGTFGKEPDAYISKSLFEEYKSKYSYPKIGEILISASGTIGRTVIFDGKDSYFQDSNIIWIENDESVVLNKFLFYFYQIANWGISVGGTIQRLYNDNLRKLSIPIPYLSDPQKSLEEQARIVAILDKFDTLTHSISEGLPREIALRQKQYEYYRDLLLTFPKPEEVKAHLATVEKSDE